MSRLGYACISTEMKNHGVYTNRTATLKKLDDSGIELADELAIKNINDLILIIKHNESMGLRFFRLTSELFPHMENPRAKHYVMSEKAQDLLRKAGDLARQLGHRITMHPGQFAQLGSPRPEVVEQTFRDLNQHAKILDVMGMSPELGSVIIIHGGGSFGDKSAALERLTTSFKNLPASTQKYIALENDEFQYSVLDLLPVCENLNIPLCVDFFHHSVKHAGQFDLTPDLLDRVSLTWKRRGIKPKCHLSDQKLNGKPGAHADYIEQIPDIVLKFARKHDADIMCECKQKEKCVFKLLRKHFTIYTQKINGELRIDWILE